VSVAQRAVENRKYILEIAALKKSLIDEKNRVFACELHRGALEKAATQEHRKRGSVEFETP